MKAIVFLADGFEECEGLIAVDILRRAGVETIMASAMEGLQIDSSTCEEDTIINMMKRDVREILLSPDYLRAREIDIIKFRFGMIDGEPHTLDDCANRYGVTRERARQIEAKALRRIRSRRNTHLRRYLVPSYDEL